jgi:hypothetical protein
MIFHWLKQRRELAARVTAEAETMIALFGDGAYYEARNRVEAARRTQRDESFWTDVRTEIARRTRGDWVDTATRYVEPDGSIKVWPRREAEEHGMKATRSQDSISGKWKQPSSARPIRQFMARAKSAPAGLFRSRRCRANMTWSPAISTCAL